jgi:hypothetical protein
VFAVVALLVAAVWYGTRITALTITAVSASGGDTISHAELVALAEAELEGTYIGIVPKRFAWLYPQQRITEAVAAVPRVSQVVVERVSGTELSIAVSEYQPDGLWCAAVASTTCVLLDPSGYPFAPAPDLRGGSFIRLIALGADPAVAKQPWTTEDYRTIRQLTTALTDQGWPISHVEIDVMRDVFLRIVGGGEFKMTLTLPIEESINNVLTVAGAEEFDHLAPGNFQYIDLRFGNKVFVNEEAPAPEAGEGATSSVSVLID